MILLILKIALLLGAIIIPLRPQKSRTKAVAYTRPDTQDANYAVNEHGAIEEINKPIKELPEQS